MRIANGYGVQSAYAAYSVPRQRGASPALLLLFSTLIVLLAGATALCWQVYHGQATRADSASVVGPPSLPAATVDAIFARMGSPMMGTGKLVEQASRATQIDDAFALGVWWVETNSGAAGVGRADRNPGSVRGSPGYPSAYDGYTIYPSYAAAIVDWFNILKSRYINRGLTTVYSICYPYVGTASAPLWAAKVINLMLRYRGEAPAPQVPQHQPLAPLLFRPLQTQGLLQEPHEPAHIQQVSRAQIAKPSSMLSRSNQLFVITLSLLMALIIALGGALIRRSAPVEAASSQPRFEPVTPLPALMVNEFSPVLEQWDRATSPLLQAVAEAVISYSAQQSTPVAEASLSGQSHKRERFPRRVMLVPSRMATEEMSAVDECDATLSTEGLYFAASSRPGISLPGRMPAAADAQSGGLLSRYSNRSLITHVAAQRAAASRPERCSG